MVNYPVKMQNPRKHQFFEKLLKASQRAYDLSTALCIQVFKN